MLRLRVARANAVASLMPLAKRIDHRRIRRVEASWMGAWTGKWCIWGATSPRYWAHLNLMGIHRDSRMVWESGGRAAGR